MREIKFRAQNFGKRWFYSEAEGLRGFFILLNPKDSTPILDQNTLCQYTGLKDKNGKEIYEGDVILWIGEKGEVKYENGAFWMLGIPLKTQELLWLKNEKCEIIGNIYENPELLSKDGGK